MLVYYITSIMYSTLSIVMAVICGQDDKYAHEKFAVVLLHLWEISAKRNNPIEEREVFEEQKI